MLDLELAWLALSIVAHLGAGVLGTVESGSTHCVTVDGCSLATAHWLALEKRTFIYNA